MNFDWPACYSATFLAHPLAEKIKTCTAALMLSHKAWSGKSGNPNFFKNEVAANFLT